MRCQNTAKPASFTHPPGFSLQKYAMYGTMYVSLTGFWKPLNRTQYTPDRGFWPATVPGLITRMAIGEVNTIYGWPRGWGSPLLS